MDLGQGKPSLQNMSQQKTIQGGGRVWSSTLTVTVNPGISELGASSFQDLEQ